jgi:hypothetical protein
VAFTYDIWCKYVVNAEKRAREHFDPDMSRRFLELEKRGFIPKLHLYAHGSACQTKWPLNYHKGVGRTDGESTERDWASVVIAALQTAEMNYGSRHAALDDHWIDRNFQRIVGLSEYLKDRKYYGDSFLCTGLLLLKWLKAAMRWSAIHKQVVEGMEKSIEDPETLVGWKKMVSDWEADHRKPDPYTEPEASECEPKSDVRY